MARLAEALRHPTCATTAPLNAKPSKILRPAEMLTNLFIGPKWRTTKRTDERHSPALEFQNDVVAAHSVPRLVKRFRFIWVWVAGYSSFVVEPF
jgi:hypothetical protein